MKTYEELLEEMLRRLSKEKVFTLDGTIMEIAQSLEAGERPVSDRMQERRRSYGLLGAHRSDDQWALGQ